MSNTDFDPAAFNPANFIADQRRAVTGAAINDNEYKPDNAVRAMQVAQALELPPTVVAEDLEHYDKEAKTQLTGQLLDKNAFLREYIARQPMATKVSNDDWGNLDAATQAMDKLRLPIPGVAGTSVGAARSVIGAFTDAARDAWSSSQIDKQYAELGELLKQTPGFQNFFVRYAAQAGAGTIAGGLIGLGAGLAGVSAAVGETAKQMGVPQAWANRLTRDVYAGLNVAMPEMAMGAPAYMANKAYRQAAGGFVELVKPYIEEGKTPPMGLHPLTDAMHVEQANLDLQNLTAALEESMKSATRERAPDMYADLLRGVTDGDIGIAADAVRTLYGDKVPAPGDGILGWVPNLADQLRAAEATGGDVKVPVADWLAKVEPEVAKTLGEYIRVRPDGVTVQEATSGIMVWHGSPHTFDAFSMEKIGSGEGAQSYGHGLYFAENQDVAKSYQPTIEPGSAADGIGLKSQGSMYRARIKADKAEFLDWDKPLSEQRHILEKMAQHELLGDYILKGGEDPTGNFLYQDLSDWIYQQKHGQLPDLGLGDNFKSADAANKLVSDTLREAGIPGIKYLDQGSRESKFFVSNYGQEFVVSSLDKSVEAGPFVTKAEAAAWKAAEDAKSQTHNYVLFDDSLVEIISRNGEAIRAAKQEAALPLDQREAFARAQAMGMTEAQMALYNKRMEEQFKGDAEAIAKRVIAAEKTRQSKEWKERKEAMRPEVVADMRMRPDIAAERLLREGRLGDADLDRVRIDPQYLTPEQREALPRNYMAKDGLPPSAIAELVGYPDGAALIAGLETFTAEKKQTGLRTEDYNRRLIDEELDRRMEAQYGKLDESILEVAQERVTALTQVEMLHEETLALATKAGLEFSITKEQLAAALKAEFEGLPVKGLKADDFLRDAGKAGREAEMLLLKQDYHGAYLQKQRQYNAIVQARHAKEFEGQMKALDKTAKRYEPRDIPRVDPATRYYIQGLLSEAGYRVRLTPDEIAHEIEAYGHGSLGDFAERIYQDGYEPDIAPWIMNPPGAADGFMKPLEQMTVREALDFKDAIDTLNEAGRGIHTVELAGERRDWQALKDNVIMPNLRERPARARTEGPNAPSEGSYFYAVDAALIRMEELAKALDNRQEYGPMFKALVVPMEAGKADNYKYLEKLTKRISGMDASLGNDWYRSIGEKIPQDFIWDVEGNGGAGSPFDLTRWNMIRMMMNWGNVQNATKLVDGIARATLERGQKPSPEHLAYVQQRIENLFAQHAQPEDWTFVKTFWDLFAENVPDIERLQRSIGAKPPKWVEGRPVQTPQGVIDGKYFPLFRDKSRNVGLNVVAPKQVDGLFGEDYRRATTSKHHLDERTGARYFVDITSGPEQIIGELQRVYHDLSFREAVMQANKVINDPELSRGIKRHYGPEYHEQMQIWLKRVARMNNIDEVWSQKLNSAMANFRVNLTMSALPLNPSVMLTPSIGTGKHLPRIMLEKVFSNEAYARDKALAMKHSREIPNLLYTLDRDASEAMTRLTSPNSWSHWQKQATELFYKPLMAMEAKTRLATWVGEWERQKFLGKEDGEAAALADSLVRERHPTAHYIDLPNLLANKNEFMRMATMFMTYFSSAYNWSRTIPDAARQGRFGDVAAAIWGVYGVAALYNYFIFTRQKQDEPWYKHISRSIVSTPMSMIPFIRDGWGWATEGYQPKSPILGLIQSTIGVGRDVVKITQGQRPKRPVRNIAELAGGTFGIPGALQAGRVGEFAFDVSTGEQRPKNVIEWLRGVMWGESKLRK